jgi:hypothetical protein
MYTFPFVIFFQVFQLVPMVTPQPTLENQPESLTTPLTTSYRTYLVSAKCPPELVGIQTPSTKAAHAFLDVGLSCLNAGSFLHKAEFKQVCA